MNYQDLDSYLRKLTPSEKWHLENPNKLSEFYKKVEKVNIEGSLVYLFDFAIRLKKENIIVSKDTRFTYIPKHIHSAIELNYIYSGSCTYEIGDKNVVLNEGDLCLCDTHVVHSTKPIGENDIVVNIAMTESFFTTSFLSRLSNEGIITSFLVNSLLENKSHSKYIVFRSNKKSKIDILMKNLMCEYFHRDIGYNEVTNSYIIIIFSELVRIFNENNSSEHDLEDKKYDNIINILKYIENNYNHCTLSTTANHFGYNSNYLGNLLKSKTGKSFSQLKMEHRMKQAAMLISHSEMPIYEIALEVGFSNLGYFYKTFKNTFNKNPQEYRDSYTLTNKY